MSISALLWDIYNIPCVRIVDASNAKCVYIRYPNLVIAVPADSFKDTNRHNSNHTTRKFILPSVISNHLSWPNDVSQKDHKKYRALRILIYKYIYIHIFVYVYTYLFVRTRNVNCARAETPSFLLCWKVVIHTQKIAHPWLGSQPRSLCYIPHALATTPLEYDTSHITI